MPYALDENGQYQWYASPLLAPSAYQPDPTGTGPMQGDVTNPNYGQPIETHYNSNLFATDATAQNLAQQLGGTVTSAALREAGGGTPGSPWTMPNANYITMPNGAVVNAGQLQQYIDAYGPTVGAQMIQQEIAGDSTAARAADGPSGDDYWYQQYGQGAPQGAPAPTGSGSSLQSYLGAGGTPPTSATAGQTWYQDPGTSQWKYGTAPAGAVTSNTSGTATPKLNTGVTADPRTSTASADPTDPTDPTDPADQSPLNNQYGDNGALKGIGQVGGYGIGGAPRGMPGTGVIPLGPDGKPSWGFKDTSDVKDILANDRKFAYTQGQALIGTYGAGMAAQDQRGRQLASTGDDLYAWMLQHPGYTPEQAKAIMNQQGLDNLGWTDAMAQSNQWTPEQVGTVAGDPHAAERQYGSSVEGLREGARNYQGQLKDVYDEGGTNLNSAYGLMSQRLNNAIDPNALGLSNTYASQHQFGPDMQQALIEDAGRTVGQGTAAVTDQLQRQANAAGTNAPLAMSAALDRQRQTGAVASADAMTKAKIQAAQLGLQAGQEQENTRLGAAQDLSGRRMQAETTSGQANQANQQFLTSGRASAGLQTGAAELAGNQSIANQQTALAGSGELAAQQRAQALAQNYQQTNQANQASQFQRGSYQDTAASQRATQEATAARNDLTAARQDTRNEEQTAYNESNSRMAGQLQAFGATTGAGQASQQNAITAAQMPTTIQKIIAGATSAAGGGQTSYGEGGVATQPTLARLGELGPEIIIKLKPSRPMSYQRRNEVGNAA